MGSSQERILTTRLSYWKIFRLVFVIFSLYLMGDAFYRWDGFKYYASFYEFLPSVALIMILWSIVAVFTAILIFLPLRVIEWFCLFKKSKIRINHLLVFIIILILLGAAVWKGKIFIWGYVSTSTQLKLYMFLFIVFISILFAWLSRNMADRWIGAVHERITPLVLLFGIFLIFSVPLVTYQTWVKQEDKNVSQNPIVSSTANKKRPNIILVTFDALSAQNMSVYGYHRPTTPFISEWAKTASLFTMAEAEGSWTPPTTASLMTGKRLWSHRLYQPHGYNPFKSDIESMPLMLKNNGYFNMAFIVNNYAMVGKLGVADSFEIAPPYHEFSKNSSFLKIIDNALFQFFGNKFKLYNWLVKKDFILYEFSYGIFKRLMPDNDFFKIDYSETQVPPEMAFNSFINVVDNNPPEPYFAWVHLHPPHIPYLPPEPYLGMFNPSTELRTFDSQTKAMLSTSKYLHKYQHFPQEIQPTVDALRDRYDEFIRYCDKQFEEFIAQLTTKGILKNTVIILSSDHGESFEHNNLGHGHIYLYEQVTHIPLIIKEPDRTGGRIINDLVEQIDIPATILDLANIKLPSWMEGRSLVPFMRGESLSSRPVFSMSLHENPSRRNQIFKGSIAVWEGDYKLMHFIDKKKSLLFNLKQDPDELDNLFDKEPEVGQRLLAIVQDSLKNVNEKIAAENNN